MANYLKGLKIKLDTFQREVFLFSSIYTNYIPIIKKNKLKEIALIMKQICMAVNHLHIMGIAHRDLKPENLLFTSKNKDALIKLIDFGFAKEEILNLSTPCFTPYYVAPEIVKSEKYDSKCDIWALGIIMYMLCFKRPPFFAHGDEPLSPGI